MTRILALFGALSCLWLLLSGMFAPLLIALGTLSSILVVYLAVRMEVIDQESFLTRINALKFARYLVWLAGEIVLSNLDVSKRILKGRSSISPTVIRVRSTQRTLLGQVIYANSITLTPGTVSINVWENEIRVHALTREAAESLRTGEMDRRVSELEIDDNGGGA